jgi:hypothetical protein
MESKETLERIERIIIHLRRLRVGYGRGFLTEWRQVIVRIMSIPFAVQASARASSGSSVSSLERRA